VFEHRRVGQRGAVVSHPELLVSWLDGVTTLDGQPGAPAVKALLDGAG
jgi:hypothetical protein